MDAPRHNELGMMIRAARKANGMTLEDVAALIGVTPGALSHIERGRRLPDPKNAARIADALGIPQSEMRRMLDEQLAERRWSNAARTLMPGDVAASAAPAFYQRPVEDLFGPDNASATPPRVSHSAIEPQRRSSASSSPRNRARMSSDTWERLDAIEQLGDTAADAIRTLRGLVRDSDPQVSQHARRALHELEVPVRDGDDEGVTR